MISILFFKLLTEFINIMIHGLLLSIFITPTLIIMLIPVIIAFSLQLKENHNLSKEWNRIHFEFSVPLLLI